MLRDSGIAFKTPEVSQLASLEGSALMTCLLDLVNG